jgi:hypothetical protein
VSDERLVAEVTAEQWAKGPFRIVASGGSSGHAPSLKEPVPQRRGAADRPRGREPCVEGGWNGNLCRLPCDLSVAGGSVSEYHCTIAG